MEQIKILDYKVYKGRIYGLKQSTSLLLFKFKNEKKLKDTIASLYDVLAFEIDNKSKLSVSESILKMSIFIQRDNNIPLFCKGKLIYENSMGKSNESLIALPYFKLEASELAFNFLIQAINYLLLSKNEEEFLISLKTLKQNYKDLKTRLAPFSLVGINNMNFLQAAFDNDIEFNHLVGSTFSYGLGKNSCLLDSTFTNNTSCVGVLISRDKASTNKLLKDLGFPVPKQYIIQKEQEALSIINSGQLPYPVVIKPTNQDGGLGVFANLKDRKSVKSSFKEANSYSQNVILEEHIDGFDYRITVFNEKVIKVVLRLPGGITGDGKSSIEELVQIAQEHPQIKSRSKEKAMQILSLDQEAMSLLKEYNLNEKSILEEGKFIALRRKANAYTGGTTQLVEIATVHEDNIDLILRISKAINLDIAGIDLLIPDITKSWHEQKVGICEINSQPQLGTSHSPECYEMILESLLKNKGEINTSIYISDKEEDIKDMHEAYKDDSSIAIASSFGVFVGKKQLSVQNKDLYEFTNFALRDKSIHSVMICTSLKDLIETGLSFNKCDLMIIENINTESYKKEFIKDALFPYVEEFVLKGSKEENNYIKKLLSTNSVL